MGYISDRVLRGLTWNGCGKTLIFLLLEVVRSVVAHCLKALKVLSTEAGMWKTPLVAQNLQVVEHQARCWTRGYYTETHEESLAGIGCSAAARPSFPTVMNIVHDARFEGCMDFDFLHDTSHLPCCLVLVLAEVCHNPGCWMEVLLMELRSSRRSDHVEHWMELAMDSDSWTSPQEGGYCLCQGLALQTWCSVEAQVRDRGCQSNRSPLRLLL